MTRSISSLRAMASTTVSSSAPNHPQPTKRQEVADLQKEIIDVLANTSWPSDAVPEAEGFSQSLTTYITGWSIPENESDMPAALLSAVESVIRDLENARGKLKTESEKYRIVHNGLWGYLKKPFSRKGRCMRMLRDCRMTVEASLERLKAELHKGDDSTAVPSTSPAVPTTETHSPHPAPVNRPPDRASDNDSSWREKILGPTKVVFKAAEALSGAIPLAGSYIGGVATFGLTCIEMIEGMDQNVESVQTLGNHISALSKTLEKVKDGKRGGKDQTVQAINELHAHLNSVRAEMDKLQSGTTMHRFWSAEKDAGTIKRLQDQVRAVLEELQLLTSTNTSLLVNELLDTTRGIENRDLLRSLGDGKSGLVGNLDTDVRCFPGTRVKVLERVDIWMRSREPSDRVLWIHGMAGRGKSTIASTVEATWRQRAVCALFHFRRGQNSLDTRLVCSLAKQLARGVDTGLRERVLASVRKNEDIVHARLDVQFKELLVDSFSAVKGKPYPVLMVIDALDECDTPGYAVDVIKLIKKHLDVFPENVKILLTSRPELPLLRELRPSKWITEDLETGQEDVERDIECYLRHDLVEIRTSQSLPVAWPSEKVVLQLAQMSQGLFQWARTLTKLIRNGNAISRVEEVLESPEEWKGVDDLYTQILAKAIDNLQESRIKNKLLLPVLGAILAATHPMSLDQIVFLHADAFAVGKRSTQSTPQDAPRLLREEVLADLNSLLSIPTTSTEPVLLMHTSIRDLLVDRNRCKNVSYWVDLPVVHGRLATTCLRRMNQQLRQNISDLRDISEPMYEVSEARDAAQRSVSAGLQYCCRSWSIHLAKGWNGSNSSVEGWKDLVGAVKTFSETKALFWLEVMSLMGWLGEAATVAKQVEFWLSVASNQIPDGGALGVLWNDLRRFISAFGEPIAFNPMQIYNSALAHCPQKTVIWERYGELAEVTRLPGTPSRGWPSEQWARSVGCVVNAVAYSPNGLIIAAGGHDGMVRLLDTQTGEQVGEPLTGHADRVLSVSFSPDGKLVASGSGDKAVRLWDTQTGEQVGESLTGHGGWVSSVSFSPDGKLVASGSYDKTVRLWDAQMGTQVGKPLKDSTRRSIPDHPRSIAFSFSGDFITSSWRYGPDSSWSIHTHQMVYRPSDLPSSFDFSLRDRWFTVGSSRVLWFPSQYWDGRAQFYPASGTLVVWYGNNIAFFNVSHLLDAPSLPQSS